MSTERGSPLARVRAWSAAAQARRPALDHLARALRHYLSVGGNQHAGAITYFSFLSFFPLVAVGFAVLGYLGRVRPDLVGDVLAVVDDNLPGLIGDGPGQINLTTIAGGVTGASIVGLVGLLYAGLGWVDALRTALRETWATTRPRRNILVRKLIDVAVLLVVGCSVLMSVALSSLATSATTLVLGWVDLQDSLLASVLLRLFAIAVAIGTDAVVLLVLFTRLPGRQVSWRTSAAGALVGAVLLETLKLAGTFLIARVTANAVYGAFAVVVGLLVWLNLVSRVVLLAAAWAVTTPGGPSQPQSRTRDGGRVRD